MLVLKAQGCKGVIKLLHAMGLRQSNGCSIVSHSQSEKAGHIQNWCASGRCKARGEKMQWLTMPGLC